MGVETNASTTTTIKTGNTTESTGMVSYVASSTDWISDCLWDTWDSYDASDKVITVKHTYRINPNDPSDDPTTGYHTRTCQDGSTIVDYTVSISSDNSTATEIYTYTVIEKNFTASDGTFQRGTQFQDIMDWYKKIDPTAEFTFNQNGQIYIDSSDNYYMEGKIPDDLDISSTTYTFTWTQGMTTTDAVKSTENITYKARTTDYIGDILWDNGYDSFTDKDKEIYAYKTTVDHVDVGDGNGIYQKTIITLVGTFTVKDALTEIEADGSTVAQAGTGTTMQDLLNWYASIDPTGTFVVNEDGSLYINSNDNIVLGREMKPGDLQIQESKIIAGLGLSISTIQQTWTTGLDSTQSSDTIKYTIRESDTVYDTLYGQWDTLNKTLTITQDVLDHTTHTVKSNVTSTTIIDESTNFYDIKQWLTSNGITAKLTNGAFKLSTTENKYVSGAILQALGFSNNVNNNQYTWTYGVAVTGSAITYNAHDFDLVKDFRPEASDRYVELCYYKGIDNEEVYKDKVSAGDMTFAQFFSEISTKSHGNVTVSLNSSGQMQVNCSNGWFIRNNGFGITDKSSSDEVTYTTGSSGTFSGLKYATTDANGTSYDIAVNKEVIYDFTSYTCASTTADDALEYHSNSVWEYDVTYKYKYDTKITTGYKYKKEGNAGGWKATAKEDTNASVCVHVAEYGGQKYTVTVTGSNTNWSDGGLAKKAQEQMIITLASGKTYGNGITEVSYSFSVYQEQTETQYTTVSSKTEAPTGWAFVQDVQSDTTITTTTAASTWNSSMGTLLETVSTSTTTLLASATCDKPKARCTKTIISKATLAQTLAQCGLSRITLSVYSYKNASLIDSKTLTSSDTLDSLSWKGINASISDGVITLTGDETCFATFSLSTGTGYDGTKDIYKVINNDSFASGVNISHLTSGVTDLTFTETVDDDNGGVKTQTIGNVSASGTLGQYVDAIKDLSYASASLSGDSISISTGSKCSSSSNVYYSGASSYESDSYYRKKDDNSSTLTTTLRGTTMLKDISDSDSVTLTYVTHTNDVYSTVTTSNTITWSKDQSLSDFLSSINVPATGLVASVKSDDGTFSIKGNENVYVTGDDFKSTLKLLGATYNTYNYGYHYQTIDGDGHASTYDTKAVAQGGIEYATLHLGGTNPTVHSTTLENLNIDSAQTISIVIHTNNTYAQKYTETVTINASGATTEITRAVDPTKTITVTWTAGTASIDRTAAKPETLQQFIDKINSTLAEETSHYSSIGANLSEPFNVSVVVDNTTGKIKLTGDEYTYIDSISNKLETALKISETDAKHQNYTYTLQYANEANSVVQDTYVNMLNTKLMNFGITSDQTIVIATNNNRTYSADMTKNGTVMIEDTVSYYTITWTTDMTLGQFANALSNFGKLNNLDTEASRSYETLGNSIYSIGLTINGEKTVNGSGYTYVGDKTISLLGNEYTYITSISDELANIFKIVDENGVTDQYGLNHYYSTYTYDMTYNNVGTLNKTEYNVDINGHDNKVVGKITFDDDRWTDQNTTLLNYDTRLNNFSIFADMTMTIETPDGGKSIEIDSDTTMQELKERLFNDYGIELTIEDHTGKLTLTPTLQDEGYYILGIDTRLKNELKLVTGEDGVYTLDVEEIVAGPTSGTYKTETHNVTRTLGTFSTTVLQNYENSTTKNLRYEDDEIVANKGTKISSLNGYEKGNGKIAVNYANGEVLYISIRDSWTLNDLIRTNGIFDTYGVSAKMLGGGRITLESTDGTYLSSVEGGSNLLEVLNLADFSFTHEGNTVINSKTRITRTEEQETTVIADASTKLSDFDDGLLESAGLLTFTFNDMYKSITISSDETFGSLINKLHEKGVNAKIENGKFTIASGYDSFSIVQESTTSNIMANKIFLAFNDDLGGYAVSGSALISKTTTIESKTLSTANFADSNTTFGTFNIVGGSLSVFKDGQKVIAQIESYDTAKSLQDQLRALFGQDINGDDDNCINVKVDNGTISIYQKGAKIMVGSNEDTSNFSAITSILSDSNGVAKSARDFYKVNEQSKVTEAGLFRNGNITAGTFTVGDATIIVEETSTIDDIVNQINTNSDSNAIAYWDSIDGEFVIKAKNTGSYFINIQAGTSNFTDILGFTTTKRNDAGDVVSSKINTSAQQLGQNSRVSINGVSYSSNSNVMGSESIGIKGLTLNLKGLSTDSSVQLTVKKDVESLSNAIQEVLDAYNALMENINTTLTTNSALKNDSTLKLLKNQIKSIMTSNNTTSSIFKNLASVGITTGIASAGDVSTASNIFNLNLNYEKFVEAFENDATSVRTLLIGKVDEYGNVLEEGIFNKIENIINNALESSSGFFARKEAAIDNDLQNVDNKIVKGNEAIERYRERLERKFMSMDLLMGNMQTQYQVYFT